MQLPQPVDSAIDDILQVLPDDLEPSAREFQAFRRSRKIRSAEQLLELVLLYCVQDLSLRSIAGKVASHQGKLSDTAVQKRLEQCVPWVQYLLGRLLGLKA